jgi:hypothetical protein
VKSLLDDGLKMAVSFVVIAVLVRWGWSMLRPFAVWLVIGGVGVLAFRYGVHRYRRW